MQKSVYAFSFQDWDKIFSQKGYSRYVLPFWIDYVYRGLSESHLKSEMVQALRIEFDLKLPQATRIQRSGDGTVKFQLRYQDGLEAETVLIPFFKRFTVCLSTQIGCGMNCGFCFTATQGLKRHLSAGEIVGQYLFARNWLKQEMPEELDPSIVFMGQGEPLHNFDELKKAIAVLNDPKLIGVGHRQMTLSTVGYLPGLRRAGELPPINFALSLHSPFEDQRTELIPLNQRYPLTEVLAELDKLSLLKRQFITFEYLLIKGYNTSDAHADALATLLGKRPALINLIPFNPFPGTRWERPDSQEIESFKNLLVDRRLRVMVRNTKGDDILAACGQLNISTMMRSYDAR